MAGVIRVHFSLGSSSSSSCASTTGAGAGDSALVAEAVGTVGTAEEVSAVAVAAAAERVEDGNTTGADEAASSEEEAAVEVDVAAEVEVDVEVEVLLLVEVLVVVVAAAVVVVVVEAAVDEASGSAEVADGFVGRVGRPRRGRVVRTVVEDGGSAVVVVRLVVVLGVRAVVTRLVVVRPTTGRLGRVRRVGTDGVLEPSDDSVAVEAGVTAVLSVSSTALALASFGENWNFLRASSG